MQNVVQYFIGYHKLENKDNTCTHEEPPQNDIALAKVTVYALLAHLPTSTLKYLDLNRSDLQRVFICFFGHPLELSPLNQLDKDAVEFSLQQTLRLIQPLTVEWYQELEVKDRKQNTSDALIGLIDANDALTSNGAVHQVLAKGAAAIPRTRTIFDAAAVDAVKNHKAKGERKSRKQAAKALVAFTCR